MHTDKILESSSYWGSSLIPASVEKLPKRGATACNTLGAQLRSCIFTLTLLRPG